MKFLFFILMVQIAHAGSGFFKVPGFDLRALYVRPIYGLTQIPAKTHEGKVYTVSKILTGVSNNNSLELLLQLGSTKESHTGFAFDSGAESQFFIFETPTFSDAGTSLATVNLNRVSVLTSDLTATHTPTTSDDGTLMAEGFIAGGKGGSAQGGGDGKLARGGAEWILAKDKDYLIRLKNTGGSSKTLAIQITFYENP